MSAHHSAGPGRIPGRPGGPCSALAPHPWHDPVMSLILEPCLALALILGAATDTRVRVAGTAIPRVPVAGAKIEMPVGRAARPGVVPGAVVGRVAA